LPEMPWVDRWNNTQVRLLGQEVMDGYSLSITNCKILFV
jgi:hypothetical protein